MATAIVAEASRLARIIQQELVTPALIKGDKSPVTVADFAVQALVSYRLHHFLDDAVLVGEESADELQSTEGCETLRLVTHFFRTVLPEASPDDVCQWIDRGGAEPTDEFWTLDPIDGTKGFLRHEQYAIALALIKNGEAQIGALGCPELSGEAGERGKVLTAIRGQGSWSVPLDGRATPQPLKVSATSDPTQARLLRSVESGHTDVGGIDQLLAAMGSTTAPVPMDSQAKYAVLAAGGGEIVVRMLSPARPDYRERIWDQAAGSIIVEEAGGRVTDLDGKPLDFSHGRTLAANRGVLATNGHLHDVALEALASIA
ncbi:MAG: inositol monophosphatase family protein [Pirellulales bacterium]